MFSARTIDELRHAIDGHIDVLERTAGEAEDITGAPPELVEIMRTLRVPYVKFPSELGGDELTPPDQLRFFSALSYRNPTAAWTGFNTAGAAGKAGAYLSDDGIADVFGNGRVPFFAASAQPTGRWTPDGAGARVSGRWRFASGIGHADEMFLTAIGSEQDRRVRIFVAPVTSLTVDGTWNVVALQGTGSLDVAADDVAIPQRRIIEITSPPLRGGWIYRQGFGAYVAGENLGFTLGVAQRFLDELTKVAQERSDLRTSAVFHSDLAQGQLRIDAVRALALDVLGDRSATDARIKAVAAWGTHSAAEVVSSLFRYCGATGLRRGTALERSYRDTLGSAQHVVVSTSAYEPYGASIVTDR